MKKRVIYICRVRRQLNNSNIIYSRSQLFIIIIFPLILKVCVSGIVSFIFYVFRNRSLPRGVLFQRCYIDSSCFQLSCCGLAGDVRILRWALLAARELRSVRCFLKPLLILGYVLLLLEETFLRLRDMVLTQYILLGIDVCLIRETWITFQRCLLLKDHSIRFQRFIL